MTSRRALGWLVLSLPFLAIFGASAWLHGLALTLGIFGGVLVVLAVVTLGVWLIEA